MKANCPTCGVEMELLNHLECVCSNGHEFKWVETDPSKMPLKLRDKV